jgi:cytoskeleton protein RodZ
MSNQMDTNGSANRTQVVYIGEHLKARREEIKISLEKVSQKTKINLNILRSLEANDFKSLPSPAYVKGFVLSYAKVVGMTPDDVLNKLEYSYLTLMGKPFPALNHTRRNPSEDLPTKKPSTSNKKPAEILEDDSKIQERKKIVVPALIFISVIAVFFSLYKILTNSIRNESTANKKVTQTHIAEEKQDSNDLISTSETTTDDQLILPPEVKPQAVVPVTEVVPEVVETKTEKKEEKKVETKPIEAPKDIAANRIFPPREFRKINLKLFAFQDDSEKQKLLPDQVKEFYNNDLENIYVIASEGNTWLSYKIDDQPIESIRLDKGKDILLQGKKVLMFFGNVKVTTIFYQNKLIDAPTPTGFKSLIFPESEAKNQVLPLFPKANDENLYTADEYKKKMKEEEAKLKQSL